MAKDDRELFLGRFTAFMRKPQGKHIDVRFHITGHKDHRHSFTGRIQGRRIAADAPRSGITTRKQENLLITISDVSELKKNEQQIEYQAFHDALTGLANRSNLHDRLKMALAHARRRGQFGVLLFMDLDRFKKINDSLGHHIGDELLIQFANRLRESIRKEDLLVRMGGDEFVILLAEQSPDRGQAGLNGQRFAQQLHEKLEHPMEIAEHHIKVTGSIGITIFPFHDNDGVMDVIREADTAMYQAKNMGRNQAAFFHSDMQERANLRLIMESELRTALEENQFELYYQPQVDIQGRICAIEALLRWQHPTNGLRFPDEFIQIMEETGLIDPLGDWVLDTACKQLCDWISSGILHGKTALAINVSAKQFQVNHISEKVRRILKNNKIPSSKVILEITESLLLPENSSIQHEIENLAELGVSLSIDDFGTGFSSLSVLQRAPIDQLKIDRRFVNNLEHDSQDTALVRTIISMAKELNMEVVAEGVETEEQRNALGLLNCDILQGFLISHPLPADEMTRLLSEQQ
jgi:diguanylate cyclase (GGDEF)-like protein